MANKKILIIEDTLALIKVVTHALEEAGFEVDTAQDGVEGLKKLKNNIYDLVILDLILPKLTGFDVLNNIKFFENKSPIIVYSNMVEDHTKEDVLNAGAQAYFDKSKISLHELINAVKKITKS